MVFKICRKWLCERNFRVATLYYVGLGCNGKDTSKEQYWYRRAMEAGSPVAVLKLAEALDHGRIGKTKSEKQEALQLHEKVLFYGNGEEGCRPVKEEAVIWYRKAAEQGLSWAREK